MGYFDNPKHRAEWERELSSLREQKARLYGDSSVSRDNDREVSREYAEPAYEQDFSEEYSESEYSEEYSAANDYSEPVREERSASVREEVRSEPVREERSAPVREEVRSAPAREVRSSRVNVHPDEEYRIRMTFQELLEMENLASVRKTTSKPHEMQRQKEVSHAL